MPPKQLTRQSLGFNKDRMFDFNEFKQQMKAKKGRNLKGLRKKIKVDNLLKVNLITYYINNNLLLTLQQFNFNSHYNLEIRKIRNINMNQVHTHLLENCHLNGQMYLKIQKKKQKNEQMKKSNQQRKLQIFENEHDHEKIITNDTLKATQLLKECGSNIQQIQAIGRQLTETEEEKQSINNHLNIIGKIVRINLEKHYQQKIQEMTLKIRKDQKQLHEELAKMHSKTQGGDFLQLSYQKKEQIKDEDIEQYMQQDQMEQLEQDEQDQAINELINNINELSIIFKQFSNMLYEQGTILDRIDFNIDTTQKEIKKANVHLEKAHQIQKSPCACKCMMILLIAITICAIFLIVKFSN